MSGRRLRRLGTAWLWVAVAGPLAMAADGVDYLRDIKPLLREKCFACHGGLKQEGSLRVDTVAAMRTGGDLGAAVVPGDPAASTLLQRVRGEGGDQMPLEGVPLTGEQISLVERWIADGAVGVADEQPEPDPRDHWAFRPPQRPMLPTTARATANPIDVWLAAAQQRQGLNVVPAASKPVLLRRVYLDLVGLPPGEEELRAFLADERPDAYERVVDRLLQSPQYGERWARHWMDVWRYSDWYGRRMVPDVWNSAPQIWRWRDWIVRSLNEDRGYDAMVREMLAGDEVAGDRPEAAAATGYLIRNWYALNPNDWMRQNVEHTAKAFLGLTFNCAHCHDHKYDPIAHEDYFRFRAFFEPIGIRQDRVAGEADPGKFQPYEYSVLRKIQRLGMVQVFDQQPEAPTWFYTGGDERQRLTEKGSIPPGLPAVFMPEDFAVRAIDLPLTAWYPGARPDIQSTIRAEHAAAVNQALSNLESARAAAEQARPDLETQLAQARSAWQAASDAAAAGGNSIALVGKQSLLLDASTGRRILHNKLSQLKTLADGTVLRFELMILQDAHINFQLARDIVQGLTAGYLAFDAGRVMAYQPGTFSEFEVAQYDFAAGQSRFVVEFQFMPSQDQVLLTLRDAANDAPLAQNIPIALNGWNPINQPHQAIALDARPGSIAVVDALEIHAPQAATAGAADELLVAFDFEPPTYTVGLDAAGREGWFVSSFSESPATSRIEATAATPQLRELASQLAARERAVAGNLEKVRAAEMAYEARLAELASLEARIAADAVRYGGKASAEDAIQAAVQAERHAQRLAAEANVAASQQQLAEAEARPAEDTMRTASIETATKQLADAQAALAKLDTSLAEEPADYSPLTPQYPRQSTGRRAALANWISSRDNPLAARVAINHIWMRHFHEPLVPSVFDFGRNGKPPTHPELLDWLAVELMESGWSMKRIHRLIVTSDAFRRSSSAADAPASLAQDPENHYLWRMNYGRVEAEVVRDSLLSVAGRLDLRMGGQELENSDALTTNRRSLYYSCHPEGGGKNPLGALFDGADPSECYRRSRSIVPQQALALTNSELVHDVSISAAAALAGDEGDGDNGGNDERFVERAFARILSREPSELERQYCHAFLQRQTALITQQETAAGAAALRARESLIRVLLNHNDFVTVR